MPDRFVCSGGGLITTVAALHVACVSNLNKVSYKGSPSMGSNCEIVKAAQRSSANGEFTIVVLKLSVTSKRQRTVLRSN